MIETDQWLVEKSRRGERAAFEEIVRRTARLVYGRIVLDVPDRHRAEDLTQEVFLAAWKSIKRLEEPGALRGWLLAIAASVTADDARRAGRKKRSAVFSGVVETVPDRSAHGDPAENLIAGDERRRALEALRGLPEEYRRVLTLRYLGGADYEAIARQLALSNGSLRGLLHRGLNLLRKRLSE